MVASIQAGSDACQTTVWRRTIRASLTICALLILITFCSAKANAATGDNYGTTKQESDRMTALVLNKFGHGWQGRCMVRIMWRESGGNPRAANYHDWYGGSYGLLQMNAVHRWEGESMWAFRKRMWNPRTHLIAAKRLYDASGFRAWGGCPG